MDAHDIRWIQRFNHFINALSQLKEAVCLAQKRQLSRLEEQGLIQAFEFTHELAWNTMKDFLENRGVRSGWKPDLLSMLSDRLIGKQDQ